MTWTDGENMVRCREVSTVLFRDIFGIAGPFRYKWE